MLLSSSDTKQTWCIFSCLQILHRENWFKYVHRLYATAINFPYITTLQVSTSNLYRMLLQKRILLFLEKHSISCALFLITFWCNIDASCISLMVFNWTLSAISSDIPCKYGNERFTMVPINLIDCVKILSFF